MPAASGIRFAGDSHANRNPRSTLRQAQGEREFFFERDADTQRSPEEAQRIPGRSHDVIALSRNTLRFFRATGPTDSLSQISFEIARQLGIDYALV